MDFYFKFDEIKKFPFRGYKTCF